MSDGPMRPFGRKLPPRPILTEEPDWKQADPVWIHGALRAALALPSGGWYALGASRQFTGRPRRVQLAGREFVAWRHDGEITLGLDACPHLGASLSEGRVEDGCVVCPWHGLRLPHDDVRWNALPTHDDGVLVWAQLPDNQPTPAPILSARPERFLDAVIRMEADCDPRDVVANRLDPWHGAHYHPYSFGRLQVVDQQDDEVTVRVVYRVVGRWGVEVDARFHCPDPRTITMTIVDGEGAGSVVETHATPLGPGRTAIIEATLATSDRPRFWTVVRPLRWALRPLVQVAARRLWRDDAAYAERLHELRTAGREGTERS